MTTNYLSAGLTALLLVGCNGNMATPPSRIAVPHFSSDKYEQLECSSLKLKIDEFSLVIKELTVAQDQRVSNSKGHLAVYGWGSGDGMETIELVKMKGEMNAVERVYGKKNCADMNNA